MADTTILHPTGDDLSTMKEFRSLQDDISESYLKMKGTIAGIASLEHIINQGLAVRLDRQRILQIQLDLERKNLAAEQQQAKSLRGVPLDTANATIKSQKEKILSFEREFNLLSKINRQALIPYIWYFNKVASLFKSMDKSAFEFRIKMGAIRDNVENIRKLAQGVALEFMHVGVTIGGAYASILALGTEMGSIHVVSKSLVETTALLKSQLGVAEDVSAGFFRNMAAVSKTTMQAQKQMAYVTAELSQAAGVPFPEVMKDVAKLSGDALAMVSRMPIQIIKASVEARRMNTTLADMAKSGRSILNFTESVNAEMEASVLLGKSINLQRARELAYRRDLVGSTKEIVRLTRSIDFENLDVFQQEAFAKATGRSVEELLKMVQAEKEIESARRSGDPAVRAQLAAYEKMRDANAETLKSNSKNLEMIIRQRANQERLTAISAKWNQIVSQAASAFLPLLDIVLSIIPYAMDIGTAIGKLYLNVYGTYVVFDKMTDLLTNLSGASAGWFKSMKGIYAITLPISRFLGYIVPAVDKVAEVFWRLGGVINQVFKPVKSFLQYLAPVIGSFKYIGAILKTLGKFSGVLNIAFAIWNVIKSITSGIKDIADGNIWSGIRKILLGSLAGIVEGFFGFIVDIPLLLLKGLSAVLPGMFGWAADLYDGWHNILKDWFGFSPSKIGLLIVKGISSVGPMLFSALTSPFTSAFSLVGDLIGKLPFMGGIAEKLKGLNPFGGGAVEKRAGEGVGNVSTVTATGRTVNGASAGTETPTSEGGGGESVGVLEKILASNCEVVAAIKNLTKLMENGGIAVNMDSQLLSATVARSTSFRNGYGVNRAS